MRLRNRDWRDVVLVTLLASWLPLGVWASAAPRSFYDSFPGFGRTWVSPDGPFNEHLLRDVGGLWLGLSALLIYALLEGSRPLVRAAGLVVVVFSVPHVGYHVTNTEVLAVSDAIANIAALVFVLFLGLALLASPQSNEATEHATRARTS